MGAITSIAGACFENLVGLREFCTATNPTSGLFLNQVGVNLDLIKSILMKDYRDHEQFVDDKIAFATKMVTDQVVNHFAEHIRSGSIIDGARVGHARDNKTIIAGSAGLFKGINVEICNQRSYLDFFLSEITLFTNFTGSVTVKVYDLVQGIEIDSLICATTAGQISKTIINKLYKSSKKKLDILIAYDTSAISSYDTRLSDSGCSSCGNSGQVYNTKYVNFTAGQINNADVKIRQNMSAGSDTGGMSLVYSIQCNRADWMCEFTNLMALPILYKSAAEIYQYGVFSTRENSHTILNSETMKARYETSQAEYMDSMDRLLQRISLPNNDQCFHCNRQSMNVISLP